MIGHSILTSVLGGSEWSTSRPGHIIFRKDPRHSLNMGLRGPQNEPWTFEGSPCVMPLRAFELLKTLFRLA